MRSQTKVDGVAASPTTTQAQLPRPASSGSFSTMATVNVAPMAKPKPAQKYARVCSFIQRPEGGGALAAAVLAVVGKVAGRGIQRQAGMKNTTPSRPSASHCPSHGSQPTMPTTARPDTAMPSPSPEKWMPSSGRWRCATSQFSTRADPSSIPAALDSPATKRSAAHSATWVVSPMPAVQTTASSRPMR